MADFTVEYEWESCIRGHHIYYPVWTSYVGEQLVYVREPLNSVDRFGKIGLKYLYNAMTHVTTETFSQ